VEDALAYIRNHPASPLLVKDLVHALATNRRSLERAFHSALQQSPRQVLLKQRLRNAQTLLQRPELRIGEVAERCGFASPEALSREFRKAFATTPRQWRKQQGG
jgi:transcriptional regulator GlxA family with amidase domain